MTVGSIRVVSKRKGGTAPAPGETIIDIDRPSGSVLQNRHTLRDHNDAAGRARVIAAFTSDLQADLMSFEEPHGPMTSEILKLANRMLAGERIALRCWCAPSRCHGDVIRDTAYRLAGIAAP